MSEEVTYATLKFSNPKTKKPQESHSLKRTGHSAPSKVWYPIAFVSLSLNLVVLAGLGALGLMHYYKLIFNSKTVYDVQLNVTDHMETTTLPTDMPTTVSVASVVSDSVRPHRRQPTSLPSPWVSPDCPYSDPALHLCSEIWIQYGSNFYNFSTKIICNTCDSDCEKNHSSLMNMDDGENRNRTKLFLRCRPLYIFQTLLNSVSNNTNQTERNVSDISILTCLVPP
ncbi:C-type lectin domain family 12 member B-like isoform X3 [Bos indicus]|uniref:C-type lectin domain family 12 member B-like isoform X3 n=1 Tax=Bos indicus TaxID=9915 RepID=A0ABM4SEM9_BOSIN